ncbi:MAG: hypothetical protein ABI618_09715 [Nitrospirota bacterium]
MMDYAKVLSKCQDPEVGKAVLDALTKLFEKDIQLLVISASERSVAAKIAQYLQPHFPNFHIDVDYNRMGKAPKKVAWSGKKQEELYPDIIVHSRETEIDILAVELKKDSNRESKEKDILKLRAYRSELGYRHALFMRLGDKAGAGEVSECEWVGVLGGT